MPPPVMNSAQDLSDLAAVAAADARPPNAQPPSMLSAFPAQDPAVRS